MEEKKNSKVVFFFFFWEHALKHEFKGFGELLWIFHDLCLAAQLCQPIRIDIQMKASQITYFIGSQIGMNLALIIFGIYTPNYLAISL